MKSILFVLLINLSGQVRPIAVYESLEQCRQARERAVSNVAAAYACMPAETAGSWTRKDARYLAKISE
jgi:hypothetical protein